MEDRKHRTVAGGIQKSHALPRALERPGLGFAVPDHARDEKIGIVEGGAERVRERVPELAPLVDRAGRVTLTWLGIPPGVEN